MFQLRNRIQSPLAQLQHLFRIPGKNPSGCSEGNAAPEAFEQLRANLLLKLADLSANRRLRPVTRLCGLGKALQPDDFQKSMELIEIHNSRLCSTAALRSNAHLHS